MESAFLSLLLDFLRTVLAVKGSLRRAQQRRALDRSGPFRRLTNYKRKRANANPPHSAALSGLPLVGTELHDNFGVDKPS